MGPGRHRATFGSPGKDARLLYRDRETMVVFVRGGVASVEASTLASPRLGGEAGPSLWTRVRDVDPRTTTLSDG